MAVIAHEHNRFIQDPCVLDSTGNLSPGTVLHVDYEKLFKVLGGPYYLESKDLYAWGMRDLLLGHSFLLIRDRAWEVTGLCWIQSSTTRSQTDLFKIWLTEAMKEGSKCPEQLKLL
jgi:hypothetical protein